jgi:hypothetical protein
MPAPGVGQVSGPAATSTVNGRMMQGTQQPSSAAVLSGQQNAASSNGMIMPTGMSAKPSSTDPMSR